jgi:hypothetical protein
MKTRNASGVPKSDLGTPEKYVRVFGIERAEKTISGYFVLASAVVESVGVSFGISA